MCQADSGCNWVVKKAKEAKMIRRSSMYSRVGTSSVIFRLISKTKNDETNWMSYLEIKADDTLSALFKEYLSTYFSKLKAVQFIPEVASIFFTIDENRIFSICRSKYSRRLRLDFCQVRRNSELSWYRVAANEAALARLYSLIDIVGMDTTDAFKQRVAVVR